MAVARGRQATKPGAHVGSSVRRHPVFVELSVLRRCGATLHPKSPCISGGGDYNGGEKIESRSRSKSKIHAAKAAFGIRGFHYVACLSILREAHGSRAFDRPPWSGKEQGRRRPEDDRGHEADVQAEHSVGSRRDRRRDPPRQDLRGLHSVRQDHEAGVAGRSLRNLEFTRIPVRCQGDGDYARRSGGGGTNSGRKRPAPRSSDYD